MLVGHFTYVASQYYSPCTTDLQRAIFMYFQNEASLSLEKLNQEPFDDTQGFKLATDHEFIPPVHGSKMWSLT